MVTFSHPYTSPTTTLTIRNPELGNADRYDRGLIYRKAMSGDLYSFTRTTEAHSLVLTFILLMNESMDDLIAFIKTVRDEEFKYTDHASVVHKVKLPMSNIVYDWTGRYARVIRLVLEEVA